MCGEQAWLASRNLAAPADEIAVAVGFFPPLRLICGRFRPSFGGPGGPRGPSAAIAVRDRYPASCIRLGAEQPAAGPARPHGASIRGSRCTRYPTRRGDGASDPSVATRAPPMAAREVGVDEPDRLH